MVPDGWTVLPVEGVSVELSAPPFHAQCQWPTKKTSRDDLSTVVRVTDTSVSGGGLLIPSTRINLQSASARTTLERSTGLEGEQRAAFATFFKTLTDILSDIHSQQQPIHKLRVDQEPAPIDWLLYPIWPDTERGVGLSAAPGSLKSYGALAIALSVATGVSVLRGTRVGEAKPVLVLDWESDRDESERRLRALATGRNIDPNGMVHYQSMRLPLTDAVHDLTTVAADFGAVIIDSESAAIGGSLIDDDRVNRFWDAVRAIGLPSFVIAHKSAENVKRRQAKFFGSIMNEARVQMAWNVERQPATSNVVWECFKDNNGRLLGHKLAWAWQFTNTGDDDRSVLQSVTAAALDPVNVLIGADTGKAATIADDIADVLAADGATHASELASLLVKPIATVRATMHKDKARFRQLPDQRWELVTSGLQDRPNPLEYKG